MKGSLLDMASQGRGSKISGSNYERAIAKKLSKGFKTNVQRTAYSGATRGIDTQYNQSEIQGKSGFVGDLFFPEGHPMSVFNYELKHHNNFKFVHFFNSNGELPSFMEQVTTDSNRLGGVGHSVPCLICHVNREDDYVAIPFEPHIYEYLTTKGSTMITLVHYKQERTGNVYRYQMIVTNLADFENLVNIQDKVYQYYKDLDWNTLNHHMPKAKPVNVKNLIDESLGG